MAAGLAGSAAVTLTAAVVHAFVPDIRFLPFAIAQSLIRAAPGGFATYFIEALGHWAMRLAVVGTSAAFLLSGAVVGLFAPRLERIARGSDVAAWIAGFLALWGAAVGLYPADSVSATRPAFALATLPLYLFGGGVAVAVFRRLLVPTKPWEGRPSLGRRYVLRSLWVGSLGLLLGAADFSRLIDRTPDPGLRALAVPGLRDLLPPAESPSDEAFDAIPGLSPEITSNGSFYVVDEEILDPIVDPATWRLGVRGKVRRPLSLTHDELLRLPLQERFQTLECISNEVGGELISTAKWIGVPLPSLLERAGLDRSAVEVVFTATSGYADSLSIDQAMDESTWIAVGMNDRVLPRAHGFPARLLSVGTYGMKNPKWLVDIEVVDAPFTGYWERRGWSKAARVKTGSRIDAPAPYSSVRGPVTVAGVAFSGDRGISMVEVSIDGGRTWQSADLKRHLSSLSWRLWRLRWTPSGPGSTILQVRAYDGAGVMQPAIGAEPHPDGASGYHAIKVDH
ncbi:MAG TPA: molybdopterin-dependent oxidoreductase [Actinomycetota bacterium]|nr:molybdopterin-dependent oxidoreductase [Actinomycetota bacterium]